MAIPFGRADVGLIKTTAGAEAGKFIDEGLTIGSAIGTALEAFSEQNKAQQAQAAELEKEMDESFKTVTGNPDKQFMELLTKITPESKRNYVKFKGKDASSKQKRQFALDNYNGIIDQVDNITGLLQISREASAFGPGMSAGDQVYSNMMGSGQYKTQIKRNENTGWDEVSIAIPINSKPELTNDIKALQKADYDSLDKNDQTKLDTYNKQDKEYKDWEKGEHQFSDGTYNPKKYQIFGANDLPVKGEWEQGKATQLALYNKNVSLKKNDADLLNPQSASSYAEEFETTIKKEKPNHYQRMDMIFGDFSKDGIDNSFASIFIKGGANTEKHPDMYKDLDGNPLVFTVGDKEITYGSDEWLADTTPEQKEQILEMHLRGENADGTVDTNKNKDLLIKKYSEFMGEVTKDAFNIRRKNHFEGKNRYFDAGDGGDTVHPTEQATYNNKALTYTHTLVDTAFPQHLLTDTENLNKKLDKGGSIAKALKKEFKDYTDIEFDFDDDGTMEVEIDGEDLKFDFNENPGAELNRLKKELSRGTADDLEVNKLSNDANENDWDEIRKRSLDHHGGGYTVGAGEYTTFISDIDGSSVQGSLKIIKTSQGPTGTVYTVQDEKGNEHNVDASKIFPQQ